MATRDFKIRTGLVVTGNTELQGSITLGGNTYTKLLDSDNITNIINNTVTGLADSDLKAIADLRNDVDSDSAVIQALDTTLGTLSTKVDAIEAGLDSETARIQLLLLSTDSDALSIAGLKSEADSDAAAIAELLRQADSDAAAIQALNTTLTADISAINARLDSDETQLQAIQTDLEAAESNITTIQSDISTINSKLDSDDVKLQDAVTRIEALESAPALADSDYSNFAKMREDIDSDSIAIQALGTRIDNLGGSQTISVTAYTFTSPANDSDFTGTDDNGRTLGYVVGKIHVYLNGILLTDTADYTATDGSTVSLVNAPDSDDVLTVVKYLGTVQAGFDSEQVVGIINENVVTDPTINTRLDSDSTAIQALGTSINTITSRLDSDETKIQAIQTQLDALDTGDIAALRADADSDSIAIQAIRTSVDSDYALFNSKIALFNGLTDSDLTTVSNLRNDVDSDSAKLQSLQTTVDNLVTVSLADSDIVALTGAKSLATNQINDGAVTDVDTFASTLYRSVKYVVVASSDSDSTYQADEILVVHDGTSAYLTQYAQIATSDSELVTYDVTISSGNVVLQATPTRNNVRFDAQRLHVSVANNSILAITITPNWALNSATTEVEFSGYPQTTVSNANYGNAVAVSGDGNYLVAAQYRGTGWGGFTGVGEVRILKWNSGTSTWDSDVTLHPTTSGHSGAGNNMKFGGSVDIDDTGTRVVIGAPQTLEQLPDGGGSSYYVGTTYVFTRTGDTWSQEWTLDNPDSEAWNVYGGSLVKISGDGNYAATYRSILSNGSAASGRVDLWSRSGTAWSHMRSFTDSDTDGTNFGRGLDIDEDGDVVVVGAPFASPDGTGEGVGNTGKVVVLERNGSTWSWITTLRSPSNVANDYLGSGVAISDDGLTLVAGAFGNAPGEAHIWSRSTHGGAWSYDSEFTPWDATAAINQGFAQYSIKISGNGNTILIGSEQREDSDGAGTIVNNAGAIYILAKEGSDWKPATILVHSNDSDNDYMSRSGATNQFEGPGIGINTDGSVIVGGATLKEPIGGPANVGSVYIWRNEG